MVNERKSELKDMEHHYCQAVQDRDIPTILQLAADPCILAGAQGVRTVGHQDMKMLMERTGQMVLHRFVLRNREIHLPAPDLGIVSYAVEEDLTVEGKQVQLGAADTSVWIHRAGKWTCALHTGSILGDPFGRDGKN